MLYRFSVTENAFRQVADERMSKPFLPLKSAFRETFQNRAAVIIRPNPYNIELRRCLQLCCLCGPWRPSGLTRGCLARKAARSQKKTMRSIERGSCLAVFRSHLSTRRSGSSGRNESSTEIPRGLMETRQTSAQEAALKA